ncbi:MAG: hypothetical protein PF541_18710 [Prolixibacteraceae bacterium]|jgi:hypothetical protein|nr:hypothetical protein [Prolixibacteraceae bacterium]
MKSEIMEVLLTSIIGIPLAFIVLRFFFKKSVLLNISILWVVNILIIDALGELGNLYPETFPTILTMGIGIPFTIACFYFVSKMVKKNFGSIYTTNS